LIAQALKRSLDHFKELKSGIDDGSLPEQLRQLQDHKDKLRLALWNEYQLFRNKPSETGSPQHMNRLRDKLENFLVDLSRVGSPPEGQRPPN
jgi:hypothetical protein